MNVVAIIQARMGASRLPGKVLLKLLGKTVLEHVIERTLKAESVKDAIVATTVNKNDLKIVKLVSEKGYSVYCGSEDDVLDRYYQVARLFNIKHIARITADCPVIDPEIIDKVIRYYFKVKVDYCANTLNESFPDGEDVEVFSFRALELAWKEAKWLSEREHVTPFISKGKGRFKIASYENKENLGDKRWTLDKKEDYVFLKILYKNLYKKNPFFGMKEILNFLKKYPEIESINRNIKRNEGYLKSLKEDKRIR